MDCFSVHAQKGVESPQIPLPWQYFGRTIQWISNLTVDRHCVPEQYGTAMGRLKLHHLRHRHKAKAFIFVTLQQAARGLHGVRTVGAHGDVSTIMQ